MRIKLSVGIIAVTGIDFGNGNSDIVVYLQVQVTRMWVWMSLDDQSDVQMLLFCGVSPFGAGAAVCLHSTWCKGVQLLQLSLWFSCILEEGKMKCLKCISHLNPRISKWAPLK